jgi:hypothetical protein
MYRLEIELADFKDNWTSEPYIRRELCSDAVWCANATANFGQIRRELRCLSFQNGLMIMPVLSLAKVTLALMLMGFTVTDVAI